MRTLDSGAETSYNLHIGTVSRHRLDSLNTSNDISPKKKPELIALSEPHAKPIRTTKSHVFSVGRRVAGILVHIWSLTAWYLGTPSFPGLV